MHTLYLLHQRQCYEVALVGISLATRWHLSRNSAAIIHNRLSLSALSQRNVFATPITPTSCSILPVSRLAWCAQAILAALTVLPPLEQELHERYLRQEAHRLTAAVVEAEQLA